MLLTNSTVLLWTRRKVGLSVESLDGVMWLMIDQNCQPSTCDISAVNDPSIRIEGWRNRQEIDNRIRDDRCATSIQIWWKSWGRYFLYPLKLNFLDIASELGEMLARRRILGTGEAETGTELSRCHCQHIMDVEPGGAAADALECSSRPGARSGKSLESYHQTTRSWRNCKIVSQAALQGRESG